MDNFKDTFFAALPSPITAEIQADSIQFQHKFFFVSIHCEFEGFDVIKSEVEKTWIEKEDHETYKVYEHGSPVGNKAREDA